MKDFANIDFISGTFPSVTAGDSSGPAVRDGTPLAADWVNDFWGSYQALLSKAGVTPSGVNESSTASDILDSIRKIAGAPGEIVYWGGRDPDASAHENRLLLLAGQGISTITYADLVDAVYCGDAACLTASAFYKSTDAEGLNPSTSGTYLKLPDCRGIFIRGLNGATATTDVNRIAAGTEAEPGSPQLFQPGTHEHAVGWNNSGTLRGLEATEQYTDTSGSVLSYLALGATAMDPAGNPGSERDGKTYVGGYDLSTSDTETRPNNVAFYAMIRY